MWQERKGKKLQRTHRASGKEKGLRTGLGWGDGLRREGEEQGWRQRTGLMPLSDV